MMTAMTAKAFIAVSLYPRQHALPSEWVMVSGKHPCLALYSTNEPVWYPSLGMALLPRCVAPFPEILLFSSFCWLWKPHRATTCCHPSFLPLLIVLLWPQVPNSPCMIIYISLSGENKHRLCCTSIISAPKSGTSVSKLHTAVCVRCLLLCQWGLSHLLCHWLHCPTAAQRGLIRTEE